MKGKRKITYLNFFWGGGEEVGQNTSIGSGVRLFKIIYLFIYLFFFLGNVWDIAISFSDQKG